MYGRRFVWIAVAALLVFGLIFAFGMDSARQQAWMQGYMMGQMAAGGGGAQSVTPLLPYMALQSGRMGGGGGSPLLLFGGILLVIFGLRFSLRWAGPQARLGQSGRARRALPAVVGRARGSTLTGRRGRSDPVAVPAVVGAAAARRDP